ncbi:MAG: AMP-binding protein [Ilumatobacteraceae bacterium]
MAGLTETTGRWSTSHRRTTTSTARTSTASSCGVLGPGVGLRVVNGATGADLPAREVGEIWINGPQVMLGYWKLLGGDGQGGDRGRLVPHRRRGYRDEDGYSTSMIGSAT